MSASRLQCREKSGSRRVVVVPGVAAGGCWGFVWMEAKVVRVATPHLLWGPVLYKRTDHLVAVMPLTVLRTAASGPLR